jgi:glycogen debranching enzyme
VNDATSQKPYEMTGQAVAEPPLGPQFVIPASTSLQERRPRTLKHGDTFAMFDHNGDVVSALDSPEGIYHRDTRYLSHLDLLLGGTRPMLLSSTLRDDNAVLTCDLTNPDLHEGDRLSLPHDAIHLRRSKFLWEAACCERLALRNFSDMSLTFRLEIRFAADFVDLFEVRGTQRIRRGLRHPAKVSESAVELAYTGLDHRRRATQLRFDPAPSRLTADHAVYDLTLAPRGRCTLFLSVDCGDDVPDRRARDRFLSSIRDARRALRNSASRAASIETSNEIFNEAVRRSVSDLYMLITSKPEGPYPYAGIPWFSAPFGRDAITTALMTLWTDPTIGRGVLGYLADNQATSFDPAADAEPGKILHEVRHGEMAELGEVPFRRYYGSVDSTPLFVMLAGAYLARTDDTEFLHRLWPNIEAALEWIDRYGDRDGDGLVEYGRMNPEGLVNQGWKDSHDSVFHADGTLARGPIALCEVQGYVYAAKRSIAGAARRLGLARRAAQLEAAAEFLRDQIEAAFWCEDLGTYALALDGDKRPCRVRTSNAGYLLLTEVAPAERAARVVRNLLDSASHSGWGIRTVAASEVRYNPMSYHNGSVWPHDNALIAFGLARYGYKAEVARLLQGLFDASVYIDLRRLPELFCGFPRRRGQGPTFYPVACAPQAWAATTPLALLQACLGIGFDPLARTISFDQPCLPESLNEVKLRGLSLGDASVDVALTRVGPEVSMHVLARRGDIRVVLTS